MLTSCWFFSVCLEKNAKGRERTNASHSLARNRGYWLSIAFHARSKKLRSSLVIWKLMEWGNKDCLPDSGYDDNTIFWFRFEFGGVSLHSGNHFTMLFDWGGRRFYFNAMGRSRRQIETVEHVASSLAKVKPNIAVYFRKEWLKKLVKLVSNI